MSAEFQFPQLLETPRLSLRVYGKIDAPALLSLIDENRQELRRNFAPMARDILQPADAIDFVDECSRKWTNGKEFTYGIWHKPSKELVGQIKMKSVAWDIASLQLAEKLGFRREGLHRNEFRCGLDELHDVFHYSLTAEDLLPRAMQS